MDFSRATIRLSLGLEQVASEVNQLVQAVANGDRSVLQNLGELLTLGYDRSRIENEMERISNMDEETLRVVLMDAGVDMTMVKDHLKTLMQVLALFNKNKCGIVDKLLQVVPIVGWISAVVHSCYGETEQAKAAFLRTTNSTVALAILCAIPFLVGPSLSVCATLAAEIGMSAFASFAGSLVEKVGANKWVEDPAIRNTLIHTYGGVLVQAALGGATAGLVSVLGKTINVFVGNLTKVFEKMFPKSSCGVLAEQLTSAVPSYVTLKVEECIVRGLAMTLTREGCTLYEQFVRKVTEVRETTDILEKRTEELTAITKHLKEVTANPNVTKEEVGAVLYSAS